MHPSPRSLTLWLGGFALWTLLALLAAADRLLWLAYRGLPTDWRGTAAVTLLDWYACAVFVPALVLATHRWPIDRRHLAVRAPLHLGLICVATFGKIALFQKVRTVLPGVNELPLAEMLVANTINELIAFGSVVGVLHSIEFYHRYREREAISLQLQARLSEAQLHALRAQLNPHFLFNVLNSATALLHRDPDSADAMLTRLGELLRLTLRADPAHEVPLRDELELLERYLTIMRIRYADRVTIRREIDEDVFGAPVPSFLLQPILENAFEHGIGQLQRPGTIAIAAYAAGGELILSVCDDGPGPRASSNGLGLGITNTRRRLQELYGAAGALTLSVGEGGTRVEVRVPLRPETHIT